MPQNAARFCEKSFREINVDDFVNLIHTISKHVVKSIPYSGELAEGWLDDAMVVLGFVCEIGRNKARFHHHIWCDDTAYRVTRYTTWMFLMLVVYGRYINTYMYSNISVIITYIRTLWQAQTHKTHSRLWEMCVCTYRILNAAAAAAACNEMGFCASNDELDIAMRCPPRDTRAEHGHSLADRVRRNTISAAHQITNSELYAHPHARAELIIVVRIAPRRNALAWFILRAQLCNILSRNIVGCVHVA